VQNHIYCLDKLYIYIYKQWKVLKLRLEIVSQSMHGVKAACRRLVEGEGIKRKNRKVHRWQTVFCFVRDVMISDDPVLSGIYL